MRYRDLFIDFDDTLYDTHGNSMIALKKLFDERHWEKIMPSYEAFSRVRGTGTLTHTSYNY